MLTEASSLTLVENPPDLRVGGAGSARCMEAWSVGTYVIWTPAAGDTISLGRILQCEIRYFPYPAGEVVWVYASDPNLYGMR